jgi:hypothetical protein
VSRVSGNTDDPSVVVSEALDNGETLLVYKRSHQDGEGGTPLQTKPVGKVLNRLVGMVSEVSNDTEAPLVYKRSCQDGEGGAPLQTTTRVKYLNTLRVMMSEASNNRYQTTKRFRLWTSVTVKMGTAALPFKQRPL